MSFLKNLFGGGNQQNQGGFHPQAEPFKLNLTKEEAVQTLQLRKETLTLVLRKSGTGEIFARVVLILDKSGSMRGLYADGTVQAVVEKLLPLGLRFDDNGELDIYLFSSRSNAYKELNSVKESDFYQYVDREILGKRENNFWGGTEYAPVMRAIVQKYGIDEPSHIPTLVIFITDGANDDKSATKEIITQAAHYPIFWQFVGIGDEEFDFLKRLDDLKGRIVDNADFFQLNDILRISDEELYQRLLTEFPSWQNEARRLGILR